MLLVALYVDDGLVVAIDQEDSKTFIEERRSLRLLQKPASYFLGLEIERFDDGAIKISQQAYAKKILERSYLEKSRPVSTPILKSSEVQNPTEENVKKNDFPYRQLAFLCT